MIRILLGLPLAALATGALFVVMHGLVKPGEVVLPDKVVRPVIDIFMAPPPPAPAPTPTLSNRVEAPPPPALDFPSADPSDRPTIVARRPEVPVFEPGGGTGPVVLAPIATLAPQFPARCQASGTEGYAVVRYDVTASGQVANAVVVDRSHACFEKAALRAIRSWRYQPAVGAAGYIRRGLTRRFTFELDEA